VNATARVPAIAARYTKVASARCGCTMFLHCTQHAQHTQRSSGRRDGRGQQQLSAAHSILAHQILVAPCPQKSWAVCLCLPGCCCCCSPAWLARPKTSYCRVPTTAQQGTGERMRFDLSNAGGIPHRFQLLQVAACSSKATGKPPLLCCCAHLPSDSTLPIEYSTANFVICNVQRKVRDCRGTGHRHMGWAGFYTAC
jgi:hypothetical protein